MKQNGEIGFSPFYSGILDKAMNGLQLGSGPICGHCEKMSSNTLMIVLLINFNFGIKIAIPTGHGR